MLSCQEEAIHTWTLLDISPDGRFAVLDVLKALGLKNVNRAWHNIRLQHPEFKPRQQRGLSKKQLQHEEFSRDSKLEPLNKARPAHVSTYNFRGTGRPATVIDEQGFLQSKASYEARLPTSWQWWLEVPMLSRLATMQGHVGSQCASRSRVQASPKQFRPQSGTRSLRKATASERHEAKLHMLSQGD